MSDSISFRIDWGPFRRILDQKEAEMAQAVAAAVRSAAKTGQDTARGRAPMLTGRLRKSITPGAQHTARGATTVGVGPRGYPHLYAQKAEKRTPYTKVGVDAARRALAAEIQAAVDRVWRG